MDRVVITVMCDYCADGLWKNGIAIDIDMLKNYYPENIDDDIYNKLKTKIDKWQGIYENFEFWKPDSNWKAIHESEDFKLFNRMGKEIAEELRKYLPMDVRVEYYDEEKNERIEII